jgi:NADP-dependent 3-hydroxy acid dehydrogenase YdfG
MENYAWLAVTAAVIAFFTFGIPLFLAEYFPWRSLYNQRHGRPTVTTESYKGRTVLITGANGAFGSRAAKIFALRDVETLVLLDVKDCGGVKEDIEAELTKMKKPKPNILVWQVDMMSYASCLEFGKKARQQLKNLDHVLMTAGILSFNRRESPEGWETCEFSFSLKALPYLQDGIITHFHNSNTSQLHLQCTYRAPPPSTA